MKDYYRILGVSPRDSTDEIRERYRFLAQAYHPDKFPDAKNKDRAEEEFKLVQEAYQVLSSPGRRAAYDATRRSGPRAAGPAREERADHRPRKPPRRRTVSFWRRRIYGLSGAQWIIALLLVLNLVIRDPFPFADELLLLALFFTIDKLLARFTS